MACYCMSCNELVMQADKTKHTIERHNTMKETYYIELNERSSDLSVSTLGNFIVPEESDPKARWIWVEVWTSSDTERRFNRFDYNFECDCWELGADDYPACSDALSNAVCDKLTDSILTKLYNGEITSFEISVNVA